MRALELTQRFPPALGGVENHVWHLAEGLRTRGVDVEVFTTDLQKDIPVERLPAGGPPFRYPVRRFRTLRVADLPHALGNIAPAMLPGVLTGRWDVLHAHAYGYFPTFAAAMGKLLERSALVVTPHSDPGRPSLEKRAFDRVVPLITLRRANRVIALTSREARYLERLGVAHERIAVIPNGVDMEEFAPVRAAMREGDDVRILFAGRCYPQQKGLEVLLDAMAFLRDDARIRLRIVGEDWGGHSVIRSMARSHGIKDRITLLGRVDRPSLIEEFQSADVFVLPSLFDSFPIAILEAMAAGLPVVATRVGGVPDIVEDGRTGVLVDPGDAKALAGALRGLASDGSARREMGRRGRERARQFSWEEILPQIKRVYEDAISECAS
jgi:glycosyltransferase involved in cell wall biosynthesis